LGAWAPYYVIRIAGSKEGEATSIVRFVEERAVPLTTVKDILCMRLIETYYHTSADTSYATDRINSKNIQQAGFPDGHPL
jgi:hypothetical protein